MTLEPHITFNGNCEAAFRYYERSLGAKIVTMLTWGNSPMAAEVPPEWRDKICHATLTLGKDVLAGVDIPSEQYQRPTSFQLVLGVDEPLEAERVFQALADNRDCDDAATRNLLGRSLWHPRRSIWRSVGNQLRLDHIGAGSTICLMPTIQEFGVTG